MVLEVAMQALGARAKGSSCTCMDRILRPSLVFGGEERVLSRAGAEVVRREKLMFVRMRCVLLGLPDLGLHLN